MPDVLGWRSFAVPTLDSQMEWGRFGELEVVGFLHHARDKFLHTKGERRDPAAPPTLALPSGFRFLANRRSPWFPRKWDYPSRQVPVLRLP